MRLFAPFAFGYFLSYLFRTVNAVIAPDLARDLGLQPASLGLLTAAYFLAFAAFQLPLGVLLDRFGPRRVEAGLLLVAAAGALVFARAESLGSLIAGRALIGFGVSSCLMAAFKGFALWFPPQRLPLANGVQMVSGGLGALFATVPVTTALHYCDWRGVFTGLAILTLLAAISIFTWVPEPRQPPARLSFVTQLQGLGDIFSSRRFWSLAPWACASQSAYLATQGLWSGPWLRDVAGFDRSAVARTLLGISLAMIAGYFSFGALAERLARRGIRPATVAATGMSLFLLVQMLIAWAPRPPILMVWLGFGFFGTSGILNYAVLCQAFPRELTGRVNAALNLLVFLGAFTAQWAIGAIIGLWPQLAGDHYHPLGYRAAFSVIIVCQLLAAGWFGWNRLRGRERP